MKRVGSQSSELLAGDSACRQGMEEGKCGQPDPSSPIRSPDPVIPKDISKNHNSVCFFQEGGTSHSSLPTPTRPHFSKSAPYSHL